MTGSCFCFGEGFIRAVPESPSFGPPGRRAAPEHRAVSTVRDSDGPNAVPAPASFTLRQPNRADDHARSSPVAPAPQEYRDPERAFCFACLLAGGGHFYSGETTRGALILGTAAAGLIGGALLSGDDGDGCDYDFETHECRDASSAPMWIGAGVAAGSWIFGIIDSRQSAARANARNGAQTGVGFEAAPLFRLPSGERAVGMRLRMTF
jgi:hypothetical protein